MPDKGSPQMVPTQSPTHSDLQSQPKVSTLHIRKCQAKGKGFFFFFKQMLLRNADVQLTDTQTEGRTIIRQYLITK